MFYIKVLSDTRSIEQNLIVPDVECLVIKLLIFSTFSGPLKLMVKEVTNETAKNVDSCWK